MATASTAQAVSLRVVTAGNASGALTGPVAGMVARVRTLWPVTGAGSPAHVTVIVAGTRAGFASIVCSKRTLVP